MLQLIDEFIKAAESEKIRYCHWKSNAAMDRTLAGINDLDLLVAEEDREKFLLMLRRLKFVRAISPVEEWFPPISNYYGYDVPSGRIIHLHLHDQLILGYDLIKNYHLPIEKEFLDSAGSSSAGSLRTPDCEMELIVFVIRMVLKRRLLTLVFGSSRDLFNAIRGLGREGLGRSARNELDFLRENADPAKVKDYLERYFPFISPELYDECLSSILPTASAYAWLAAGRHLTRALKSFRRHASAATVVIVVSRGLGLKLKGLLNRLGCRKPPRKRLTPNGKIIAFLGGDGAGKTTNIASLSSWFGNFFEVTTIHLGKPSKGPLWYLLGGGLKIRQLLTGKAGDNLHQSLKLWLIARYRYRAFRRALQLRSKGTLVCLDRLPLPGMRNMDSPRIGDLTGRKGVYSYLARQEEAMYAKIRGVDDIIVLRLDPAIAAIRRPMDNPEILARRSGEIWHRDWSAGFAHPIDASRPLNEVEAEVRSLVWASLRKQPRIIELIGPAGAGKSSAARYLFNSACDLQTSVSWRDHPFTCLKVVCSRLPQLLGSIGQPFSLVKTLIGCEVALRIMQQHRQKQILPCRDLVLEAGPIAALAYLQSNQLSAAEDWLNELKQLAALTIDAVIWLDASNDTLKNRVDTRTKSHRLKHTDQSTTEDFFKTYRHAFSSIVGPEKIDLPLTHIDTGQFTVGQVSEMINGLLHGSADG